jgi:hypothetical protein
MVAIQALLDTSVVIDVLRSYPPALTWFQQRRSALLGVTPAVVLEVIYGAPNKARQKQATTSLSQFTMVYPVERDYDWAIQQLIAYRLSHNVGVVDCMIAAPAYRLQLPMYTTNMKHFQPLLGRLAVRPY